MSKGCFPFTNFVWKILNCRIRARAHNWRSFIILDCFLLFSEKLSNETIIGRNKESLVLCVVLCCVLEPPIEKTRGFYVEVINSTYRRQTENVYVGRQSTNQPSSQQLCGPMTGNNAIHKSFSIFHAMKTHIC